MTKKFYLGFSSKNFADPRQNSFCCVQIFSDQLHEQSICSFEKKCFVHAAFAYNFCEGDLRLSMCYQKKFLEEVAKCQSFGLNEIILHFGAHKNTERGIENFVLFLDNFFHRYPDFDLYVENSCKNGRQILFSDDIIFRFFRLLRNKHYFVHVKLCIDTAHCFASGWTIDKIIRFVRKFNIEYAGKLDVFHLNDYEYRLGYGKDRHFALFSGGILDCVNFVRFFAAFKRIYKHVSKKIYFIHENSQIDLTSKKKMYNYFNFIVDKI